MKEIMRGIIASKEILFADSTASQYSIVLKDGLVTIKHKNPVDTYFRKRLELDEREFIEMMEIILSYIEDR